MWLKSWEESAGFSDDDEWEGIEGEWCTVTRHVGADVGDCLAD